MVRKKPALPMCLHADSELARTGQSTFPDPDELETRVGDLVSNEEEEVFVHQGFCEAGQGLSVRDHSGGAPDSLARPGGNGAEFARIQN
jgi:hypothetical protein